MRHTDVTRLRALQLEAKAARAALEEKFLGSGMSTAAARKRFTAVRKTTREAAKSASGRRLAQAAGLDARVARANSYLTARARRAADRESLKTGKLTISQIRKRPDLAPYNAKKNNFAAYSDLDVGTIKRIAVEHNFARSIGDLRKYRTRESMIQFMRRWDSAAARM